MPDRTKSQEMASLIAEMIQTALTQTYRLSAKGEAVAGAYDAGNGGGTTIEHQCTASLGVAMFTHMDTRPDDILKRADQAMYQAKASGRNQIRFADAQEVWMDS